MKQLMVVLLIASWAGAMWVPVAGAKQNSVRGVVLRAGQPVRSAWVVITQGGTEKGRSLTGDDGRYYIGNLANGTYQIAVNRAGLPPFRAQITLPNDARFNINM